MATDTREKPTVPPTNLSNEDVDSLFRGIVQNDQTGTPQGEGLKPFQEQPTPEGNTEGEANIPPAEEAEDVTFGSVAKHEVQKKLANAAGMGWITKNRDLDARFQGSATYNLFRVGTSGGSEETMDQLKKYVFKRTIASLEKKFKKEPIVAPRKHLKKKALTKPIPFSVQVRKNAGPTTATDISHLFSHNVTPPPSHLDMPDEITISEPDNGEIYPILPVQGEPQDEDSDESYGQSEEEMSERNTSDAAPQAKQPQQPDTNDQDDQRRRMPRPRRGLQKRLNNMRNGGNPARPASRVMSGGGKAGNALLKGGKFALKGGGVAARGLLAFFATPPGWITLAVILVILIILLIWYALSSGDDNTGRLAADNGTENISANINCPERVATLEENITCTISASHPTNQIIVKVVYSSNATLVSASEGYTEQVRSVIWEGQTSFTGEVVLHPTILDSQVETELDVQVVASTGGGEYTGSAEYVAPNSDICSGRYLIFDTSIDNFGNPNCDFTKADLYNLLTSLDPPPGPSQSSLSGADFWFFYMAPCESSYEPNAFNGTGLTPDAAGAWGLWQMGSSNPPGQAPPAPGKNGVYDRGDVNWPVQTTNAVTYAKNLVANGNTVEGYWAGSRPEEYNKTQCFIDPASGVPTN